MTLRRRAAAPILRRVIPSRLAAVDSVCREVRELIDRLGLVGNGFAVELLARESLNNAVIHGNRRDPGRKAVLELRLGREWIRLQVSDQGRGFSPRAVRAAAPCGPEASATSGRGLCIYRLYAERTSFNRRGNRVAFWIRIHPEEGSHAGIRR